MSDINYEAYPVYASYSNWEDLAAAQKKEIERLRSENERLWSLCRNVYGSDRFIREALGEETE